MSEAEEMRMEFILLAPHVRRYLVRELELPRELGNTHVSTREVTLDALVSPLRLKGREKEAKYVSVKNGLSSVCGWDAPPDWYDQVQYDFAARQFIPYALRM